MAKKELKWMPLLGQFMTLSNAVFVNRSKRQDAVAVFAKVAQTMKEKSVCFLSLSLSSPKLLLADSQSLKKLSLFIFPEGTRSASPTPSLLPFKKGAFHLAVQAQLPIVPIVCENYSGIYSSKHKRFDSGEIVVRGQSLPLPSPSLPSGTNENPFENSSSTDFNSWNHLFFRRYH